jgi:phosphoglycerate dehydrogenase-like enzyme
MKDPFHIALTADFFADGKPLYADIGLGTLEDDPAIRWHPLAEYEAELHAEQLTGANAVLVLASKVTARSLANAGDLLAVARFGVGYDSVDVAACTANNVVLTIAAGAVDRPMAEATVAWLLALTHHVGAKDRLLRAGDWPGRSRFMGTELRDRTLGVVGFGGIGRALVQLLAGFGMNAPLACDPYLDPARAAGLGVRLVPLDELLREADFVSIHCPLTDGTRNLIGAREIGLMKPTAYLVNTARGGIVDEDALYDALAGGRLGGAALDVFAEEPVTRPPRFAQLNSVLLAPHCIGWTHELFRDLGRTACRSLVDLAHGRRPAGVVNPEVFERPGFVEKWLRLRVGSGHLT